MYYGLLSVCAIMFGSQFLFTQKYKEEYGSDFKAMVVQSIVAGIVGFVSILLINGLSLGILTLRLLWRFWCLLTVSFAHFAVLKPWVK